MNFDAFGGIPILFTADAGGLAPAINANDAIAAAAGDILAAHGAALDSFMDAPLFSIGEAAFAAVARAFPDEIDADVIANEPDSDAPPTKPAEEVSSEDDSPCDTTPVECSVCLTTCESGVECVCGFKCCTACLIQHYKRDDTTNLEILPVCMACKKGWPLSSYAASTSLKSLCGASGVVSKTLRSRLGNIARMREIRLLPVSLPIANIYRMRQLFIEALVQYRYTEKLKSSSVSIKRARGATKHSVEGIECVDIRGGEEALSGVVASLFREIINSGAPEKPENTKHIASICAIASSISEATGAAFDFGACVKALENKVKAVVDASESVARKIHNERFADSGYLLKFATTLPREWWLSSSFEEMSQILVDTARTSVYASGTLTRTMFKRPTMSFMGVESGKEAQRVCTKAPLCRGFMFTTQKVENAARSAAAAAALRRAGVAPSVTTVLECQLCGTNACTECHESIAPDHVCNADVVASVREINSTTRPCPRCAARISRTEGCRHMFCTRCNQPYDWETLEPQVANTNPEFHAWIEKIRDRIAKTGNLDGAPIASDTETLKKAFEPTAIGDDGLSPGERLLHISMMLADAGMPALSCLVAFLRVIETRILTLCVGKVPTPHSFERLRIRYLTNIVSEEEWHLEAEMLELSSFVYQNLIVALEVFCTKALAAAKAAFRTAEDANLIRGGGNAEMVSRASIEHKALVEAAVAAAECSDSLRGLAKVARIKSKEFSSGFFKNASKFLDAVNGERDLEPTPRPNVWHHRATRATLINGGHSFGVETASEAKRVRKIFEPNFSPDTILNIVL